MSNETKYLNSYALLLLLPLDMCVIINNYIVANEISQT